MKRVISKPTIEKYTSGPMFAHEFHPTRRDGKDTAYYGKVFDPYWGSGYDTEVESSICALVRNTYDEEAQVKINKLWSAVNKAK